MGRAEWMLPNCWWLRANCALRWGRWGNWAFAWLSQRPFFVPKIAQNTANFEGYSQIHGVCCKPRGCRNAPQTVETPDA